jgi:kumamolisin
VTPDPNLRITVTIVIRRPQQAGEVAEQLLSGRFQPVSRDVAEKAMAADPDDLQAVRDFVREHGLVIVSENAPARTIRVEGTIQQMDSAFGVKMAWSAESGGNQYLSYRGQISLPSALQRIIEAVLGLDQRPVARPHPAGSQ